MSKIKCEDIGFAHCWVDKTSKVTTVLTSSTPQVIVPPQIRECANCFRRERLETIQPLRQEWVNDLVATNPEASND